MTFDWALWPLVIVRDQMRQPSVDVSPMVRGIEAMYAEIGAAMRPAMERLAADLEALVHDYL